MEKLQKILDLFSNYHPQFKKVKITIIDYDYVFVAKCKGKSTGEYYIQKKNRLRDIIPTEILLTKAATKEKESKLIFIFIHECSHGITPTVERKVKNDYVRIDHSRHFYDNFLRLLNIAFEHNLYSYKPKNIKELMRRDNRKENIKNDYKRYG